MNQEQWETLVAVVRGETRTPLPTGFIIDCPWLPNWAGHTILDYFTDERMFLEDNLKAIRTFPSAIFLPGFWSEFGMCTEPSAFGALCSWPENEFPFAKPLPGGLARCPNHIRGSRVSGRRRLREGCLCWAWVSCRPRRCGLALPASKAPARRTITS